MIAFCWLDSTVSTEEPLELPELLAPPEEELEVPPQPAITAAAPSATPAASHRCWLIHRFIEEYTFSLIKESCRVCGGDLASGLEPRFLRITDGTGQGI
ncbi:MAG: hypothetical protein ACLP0L_30710, partial [Solirubrobacteraceae bacterium]